MSKRLFVFLFAAHLALAVSAAADELAPAVPEVDRDALTMSEQVVEAPELPMPAVSASTEIFRRTPTIDGQVADGEWDSFYSFNYGDLSAETFLNWDNENLYVGAQSNKPVDLLIILDANNDGWFHGADNYEFDIRRGESGETPTLSVSRYESRGTADAGGAPLAAAEASGFILKAGAAAGDYTYELAIPRAKISGLKLKNGREIGIKAAVGTGEGNVVWIPAAPLGEVQPAKLVSAIISSSDAIDVSIKLQDDRVAHGEDLVAKITLKNKSNEPVPIDSIVIGGEGTTAGLLGSQLIRLEGINPGKKYSTTFRCAIPKSARTGSAALGIEARANDDQIVAALRSFDILPSFTMDIDVGDGVAKQDNFSKVAVLVRNHQRKDVYGNVTLSLPEGWEFRWKDGEKSFKVPAQDAEIEIVYWVKPPEKAWGKVPVLAEITIDDVSESASAILSVE